MVDALYEKVRKMRKDLDVPVDPKAIDGWKEKWKNAIDIEKYVRKE